MKWSWRDEFNSYFAGQKILITGATGFLGYHLCEAFINLGAEVFGIALPGGPTFPALNCKLFYMDLNDQTALERLVNNIKPDLIYHLAGLVNTSQEMKLVLPTLRENLNCTLNILLSVTATSCTRVIVVGSSETPRDFLADASTPSSPYAASKLAVSAYAKMFHDLYKVPVTIARPHMCYGPGQPSNKLIPYVITSFLNNVSPQLSSGNRICDVIYINDLIRGFILMGEKKECEGCILDFGSGVGITIRDIVEQIKTMMIESRESQFGSIPDRLLENPQIANIDLTYSILNWKPIWNLQQGLDETVLWYRNNYDYIRSTLRA